MRGRWHPHLRPHLRSRPHLISVLRVLQVPEHTPLPVITPVVHNSMFTQEVQKVLTCHRAQQGPVAWLISLQASWHRHRN